MVNCKAKTCSSIYFKGNCVLKFPNFHWEIHERKFAVNTKLRFRDTKVVNHNQVLDKKIWIGKLKIQWNSVITNSSGPAKSVRYNRVNLCTKWTFGTKIFVRYNRVFVITEFVITEFHYIMYKNLRLTDWNVRRDVKVHDQVDFAPLVPGSTTVLTAIFQLKKKIILYWFYYC